MLPAKPRHTWDLHPILPSNLHGLFRTFEIRKWNVSTPRRPASVWENPLPAPHAQDIPAVETVTRSGTLIIRGARQQCL